MIQSMTGFGRAIFENTSLKITTEIKSLNSKQLDCFLRIHPALKSKEIELRNIISTSMLRGKVEVSIQLEFVVQNQHSSFINEAVFKQYYAELTTLHQATKKSETDLFSAALRNPDVYLKKEDELSDEDWNCVKASLDNALKELFSFRKQEGNELKKDIEHRIQIIQDCRTQISTVDKPRLAQKRERILQRIQELNITEFEPNRLEQEILFYSDKLDITEELVRLDTHCVYFTETMNTKLTEHGKKLGFIAQEIGREINTIGSKANDAEMQKLVVTAKEELEKIKEQLNNVL